MSLIGSLEDLGLGDILQIIHLSQKSGVLCIRGNVCEGRVVFQGGLVRLASLKGDPEDLHALLVERGFVSEADFKQAVSAAAHSGEALCDALAKVSSITLERIDSMRRECVEHAVGAMFSWTAGEFSFDVGAEEEFLDSEMALSVGVNTQYLAMESLRVWDESGRANASNSGQAEAEDESNLNLDLSAEEMFGVAGPIETPAEASSNAEPMLEAVPLDNPVMAGEESALIESAAAAETVAAEVVVESVVEAPPVVVPTIEQAATIEAQPAPVEALAVDALVASTAERIDRAFLRTEIEECEPLPATGQLHAEPSAIEAEPLTAGAGITTPAASTPRALPENLPPVVVIDPQLSVLEWVRSALDESFGSVHIFQRSQQGLGRIRQYLSRAQTPILLVSPGIEGNPLSGIVDAADFVQRLQGQAPRMPILWLVPQDEEEECLLPIALPTVIHPSCGALAASSDAREVSQDHATLANKVAATLIDLAVGSLAVRASSREVPAATDALVATSYSADLERLKAATQLLNDSSNRGEILPVVMRFAAETFSRIAIFMVRGDEILGMAQLGVEHDGGPDDVEIRALHFARDEVSRFREVIESKVPLKAPVRDAGDRRVCELLVGQVGESAYVAPLMSSENVVALLYADNGSAGTPLGDTSALEVVLHHAGLALDRAALERALAEV